MTNENPTVKSLLRYNDVVPYGKTDIELMRLYVASPEYHDITVKEFFDHVRNTVENSRYLIEFDCVYELRSSMTEFIKKFGVGACVHGVGRKWRLYINDDSLYCWLQLSGAHIIKIVRWRDHQ